MAESKVTFDDLVEQYKLAADDFKSQISDSHCDEISCSNWRSLPSHLGLEEILVNDLERDYNHESERRSSFFKKWKERQGSAATYKRLITALLDKDLRDNAESVCKLLQKSTNVQPNIKQSICSVRSISDHQHSGTKDSYFWVICTCY